MVAFYEMNYLANASRESVEPSESSYLLIDGRPLPLFSFVGGPIGQFTWSFVFASSVSYNIDTLFITGVSENIIDFSVSLNTGTAYFSYTVISITSGFGYVSIPAQNIYGLRLSTRMGGFSATAMVGEVIATKKLFSLTNEPSKITTKLNPTGYTKKLINNQEVFNKIGDKFSCELQWDFLFGEQNTSTVADLQKITELVKDKPSFLIWINDNNDYLKVKTMRPQDIYKVRPVDDLEIDFNILDYALEDFSLNLEEVN
jgi:hypothetical protein